MITQPEAFKQLEEYRESEMMFKRQALVNWSKRQTDEVENIAKLESTVNLVCLTASIELKLADCRARQFKARRRMQHAFKN